MELPHPFQPRRVSPKTTKRGSFILGMKYSSLTRKFAEWLFPLIDRHDCGFKHTDGRPRPFNRNWDLDNWKRLRFPPRQITRTNIEVHLNGEDTLYYRSLRECGYIFAMIDIDAHEGQTDAEAAADWLVDTYFPGAYLEPSTGGLGRHIYLVLRIGSTRRSQTNENLKVVADALAKLVKAHSFTVNVCGIYGTFTTLNEDRAIHRRGQLAKIPRLGHGQADLERLICAPVFLPCVFDQVLDDVSDIAQKVSRETYLVLPEEDTTPEKAKALKLSVSEGFKPISGSPDPLQRMNSAVSTLFRKLGRTPSIEEALVFYEQQQLNTGPDENDRRKIRAQDAIAYFESTFDYDKAQKRGFAPDEYIPLIQQFVKPEHRMRDSLCYKKEITDEDLAIALYQIERTSFFVNPDKDYQFTCGWEAIRGTFQTLKESGVTTRGCNKPKAICLRQILERAGLAETIDASWRWSSATTKGRAKKIVIGPNHPRRREWELDMQSANEHVAVNAVV